MKLKNCLNLFPLLAFIVAISAIGSEEDFGFESDPAPGHEQNQVPRVDYSTSDVGSDVRYREIPSSSNFFGNDDTSVVIDRNHEVLLTDPNPSIPAPPPPAPAFQQRSPGAAQRPQQQNPQAQQQQHAQRQNQNPTQQQTQQQITQSPFINNTCLNLRYQCLEHRQDAAVQCDADAEGNRGQRQAQSSLSQIGRQLSAASAQSGTGGATFCATMSAVSAAANTSIAGIKYTCGNAQSSCKDSCTELMTKINSNQCTPAAGEELREQVTRDVARSDATQYREQCNRLAARAAESSQAMSRAASDLLTQSQRCIDNQYAGGLSAYCQTNPTSPACMTLATNDCSNEQAARTNPVCVCRANPGHADCRLVAAVNNRAGSLESSGAGGAQLLKSASGSSSLDFSEQSSMAPGDPGPRGLAASVGGRKNLNPLQDGNGTAPAGAAGRAGYAGNTGDQAKIYRGGGSPRVNGAGWGQGQQAQRNGDSQGIAGNRSRQNGGVDLRAFLPGGAKDPNARDPASMVGVDGITSAYGKSNFQKIADRYFHLSYEGAFLPPDYVAPGKVAGQRVPGK